MNAVDHAYPIGKFEPPAEIDAALREKLLAELEAAPRRLREAVERLSDSQLDTPYRDGGWTVRQVVHHLTDADVNAYVRTKIALTENEPMVRYWEQEPWAELPDAKHGPIEPSLALFESLHAWWLAGMRLLPVESFGRRFRHPRLGMITVDLHLALYDWHCRHHIAQIASLAARRGWK